MLKYLTKISMDIFPSVLATIIGAYIVNHYVNNKPAADAPAAAMAPATTKKDAKTTDLANLPPSGVKAKGISEKAVLDRPAAEKPVDKTAEQPVENKPPDPTPAEIAVAPSAPSAARGRQTFSSREKANTKSTPASVQPSPVVAAPAMEASPAPAAPDATDLARAAIERLRKSPEATAQETARPSEPPPVQEASRIATAAPAAARPLPPPITVSTPGSETYGVSPANPPYTASVSGDDVNRPTPPADIPVPIAVAPPLDLRADATNAAPKARTNVAEEMLSAARSVFHTVLPKSATPD